MATTTSTTKIDNIMKKVLSSLTDPRGRIKKDANRKIAFCITYTIKESMWGYLGFAGDNFFKLQLNRLSNGHSNCHSTMVLRGRLLSSRLPNLTSSVNSTSSLSLGFELYKMQSLILSF